MSERSLAVFVLAAWAIHRCFRRYEPQGAVVEPEADLDGFAPMIGTRHGNEIHEWVRYRGERDPPGLGYRRSTSQLL